MTCQFCARTISYCFYINDAHWLKAIGEERFDKNQGILCAHCVLERVGGLSWLIVWNEAAEKIRVRAEVAAAALVTATSGAREAAEEIMRTTAQYPTAMNTNSIEAIISKHFPSAVPVEEQGVCDCHTWPTISEMHDYCVVLETIVRSTQPEHKCKSIARAVMDEGRDWWIGELLQPVPEWPKETHCLHMKTPIKDVSFLCNAGDFEQLMVLGNVIVGLKSLSWLESMTEGAKSRSTSLSGDQEKQNERSGSR